MKIVGPPRPPGGSGGTSAFCARSVVPTRDPGAQRGLLYRNELKIPASPVEFKILVATSRPEKAAPSRFRCPKSGRANDRGNGSEPLGAALRRHNWIESAGGSCKQIPGGITDLATPSLISAASRRRILRGIGHAVIRAIPATNGRLFGQAGNKHQDRISILRYRPAGFNIRAPGRVPPGTGLRIALAGQQGDVRAAVGRRVD